MTVDSLIFPGQLLKIGDASTSKLTSSSAPIRSVASVDPAAESRSQSQSQSQIQSPAPEDEVPQQLLLNVGYGMTTLTATDLTSGSKATLYSSYDVSTSAGWRQSWTPNFGTTFSANLRSIGFEPSSNSKKSIANASKLLTGFSALGDSQVSNSFRLSYGLLYQNEMFIHGMSTSTIAVDAVPVPSAEIGAKLRLFSRGKTSLGVRGQFDYLFASTANGYSVDSGTGYRGGFFLQRRYGVDSAVELNIDYQTRTQNTSVDRFQESSVFGTLNFSVPLFEGGV